MSAIAHSSDEGHRFSREKAAYAQADRSMRLLWPACLRRQPRIGLPALPLGNQAAFTAICTC